MVGGGEGAKERRRLKRMKEGGDTKADLSFGATTSRDDDYVGTIGGPSKEGIHRSQKKSDRHPLLERKKREFASNTRTAIEKKKTNGRQTVGKDGTTSKKNPSKSVATPKFKKPKHLKRKLEQVSQEDNGQTREELLKKLEEWEERKAQLAKKQSKRQRGSPSRNNDTTAHNTIVRVKESQGDHVPINSSKGNVNNLVSGDSQKGRSEINHKNAIGRISNDHTDSDDDASNQNIVRDATVVVNKDTAVTSTKKPVEENRGGGDDDSDEDVADDDMEDAPPAQRRQRGRGRRGRKGTAKAIEETQHQKLETKSIETSNDEVDLNGPTAGRNTHEAANSLSTPKSTDKKVSDRRYCIGRKPVTDFFLGQTYPARVVYVKPFGVFFDIGCHSDAFCHVSRLSDDFVESPETMFKEGDHVPNARVVEIDRKQKRITVSLQSEARIVDERASIEARKNRKETRKSKARSKGGRSDQQSVRNNDTPSKEPAQVKDGSEKQKQRIEQSNINKVVTPIVKPPPRPTKAESVLTSHAEQKRKLKLARRAARREQASHASLPES